MRSALRGGVFSPSRQPASFRIADQTAIPSRITLFGGHPWPPCRRKLVPRRWSLMAAPLAGIVYDVVIFSLQAELRADFRRDVAMTMAAPGLGLLDRRRLADGPGRLTHDLLESDMGVLVDRGLVRGALGAGRQERGHRALHRDEEPRIAAAEAAREPCCLQIWSALPGDDRPAHPTVLHPRRADERSPPYGPEAAAARYVALRLACLPTAGCRWSPGPTRKPVSETRSMAIAASLCQRNRCGGGS